MQTYSQPHTALILGEGIEWALPTFYATVSPLMDPTASLLKIKNPHSILAALLTRPRDVLDITLPKESSDPVWEEIAAFADANRIKVLSGPAEPRDGGAGGRDERSKSKSSGISPKQSSQKAAGKGRSFQQPAREMMRKEAAPFGRESAHGATLRPRASLSVEEVFGPAKRKNEEDVNQYGVWLALDTLQDPQNVGAIFRAASFFGVKGIILTNERSAPMTSAVYDVSAGGVEYVPFCQTINLQRAFEKAKDSDLWILGTSEHAKDSLANTKLDRNWLVVLGNEEKGLRRLTEEACDMMVTIPGAHGGDAKKGVTSLNVSVANGILLSHFLMK